MIFQDSHPYSSVEITDAFKSRIRSLLGSLGKVRMLFRSEEIAASLTPSLPLEPSFEVPPSAATGGTLVCVFAHTSQSRKIVRSETVSRQYAKLVEL